MRVEAEPSPQMLQDALRAAERNLLGLQGEGRNQQRGKGQTLAFSTHPLGSPRRVALVAAQTTRKERSDHSELSLRNSRINSVNKAVA